MERREPSRHAEPPSPPATTPRRAIQAVRRILQAGLTEVEFALLWIWFRIMGAPRVLVYSDEINLRILRAFGARVGRCTVRSPVTLHTRKREGYRNLTLGDSCVLSGNNFLDLQAPITIERGVSLGPGVVVMTHNVFNRNPLLTAELPQLVGTKPVVIGAGANIRPNAVILHGATIGHDTVVAGTAVVRNPVPPQTYVARPAAEFQRSFEETESDKGAGCSARGTGGTGASSTGPAGETDGRRSMRIR